MSHIPLRVTFNRVSMMAGLNTLIVSRFAQANRTNAQLSGWRTAAAKSGREQCVAVAGMLPSVCSGMPLCPMSKVYSKGALASRDGWCSTPGYGDERRAWGKKQKMSVGLGYEVPSRRRVYYAEWTYRVGEKVKSVEMSVIVLSRHRTAQGRELYQVWVCGKCYGRPYRWILGKALG